MPGFNPYAEAMAVVIDVSAPGVMLKFALLMSKKTLLLAFTLILADVVTLGTSTDAFRRWACQRQAMSGTCTPHLY